MSKIFLPSISPTHVRMRDAGSAASSRGARLKRRLAIGAASLLLVMTIAVLGTRLYYDEAIYPGVNLSGIEIGGLSKSEAMSVVDERTGSFIQNPIALKYGDKMWSPALSELGASIAVESALTRAFAIGRSGTPRDNVVAFAHLINHDEQIPLELQLDQAQLNAWFDKLDDELGQPAQNAELVIVGTDVSISPERDGLVVDRVAATELVNSALRTLQPVTATLPVLTQQPAVLGSDLSDDEIVLRKALSTSIDVAFESESWTIAAKDIAPFLSFSADDKTYEIDEAQFATWLKDQFGDRVNRDPIDAKVSWDNERKGLIAVERSVDGITIKPRSFAKAVIASFWGDHLRVDIPVAVSSPTIDSDNLKSLGITTRLAVGDSNYEGSNDGRATNIEVGAQLLNGTLVSPGQAFSFNRSVGIINEERGFVEAQVIVGERIGRDIGGGICQVSTTVYRAALKAGLEITEWWPHTYRLAFYEQDGWQPGFDASILQPEGDPFGGGDFQFTNTSDSWMLVESYSDGARVVVIIYGADLGYKVSLSELQMSEPIPPAPDLEIVDETLPAGSMNQTETAIEGLETTFTRTVTDKDGNVIREDTWPTRFEPRGNVWRVSPDMKGQSPVAQSGS